MTTFTSRGVPMAEATDSADIAARINPVAQKVHDRPGVSALTTAQRNALAGSELWGGRVIFNTTTQAYEMWRSDFSEWHEGLDAPASIKEWPSATIPAGWRKQDGAAVSRTTYAALFARIGTTYGAGDGSTTFNLPNRGGRMALDANGPHPLGQTGGAETHTLTVAEMPSHNHGITDPGHEHSFDGATTPYQAGIAGGIHFGHQVTNPGYGEYVNPSTTGISVNNNGGGAAHNNMPPFQATHVLIKV